MAWHSPFRHWTPAAQAALAVLLVAGLSYTLTVAPSVGHGHDTGELTVAAATLGVPHPPGYPLYTRLGWLFCLLLPGSNVAWKLNLFSALGVAVAGAAVAWVVTRVTTDGLAGWVGGMLFCWAKAPWDQAVAAEVFGLHLALLGGLAVAAQLWSEEPTLRRRHFLLLALLFGLGAAHHHTLVLAAPGLAVFALLHERRIKEWGWTPWLLAVFLLASVPWYLDMMLRSRGQPPLDWGSPTDFQRLLYHFLRRAYGTFRLSASSGPSGSGEAHAVGYAVSLIRRQFPLPLFGLAGLALWFPPARLRPLAAMALVWAISYGPFFSWLGQQIPDEFHLDMQERFYASSYLAVALLCGLGAHCLRHKLTWVRPLLWASPLLSLWLNGPVCTQAGQYQAYDTTRAMFDQCAPDSILVLSGDLPAGCGDYLQYVEGYRRDLVNIYPGLIGVDWFQRRLPPAMRQVVQPGDHNQVLHTLMEWQVKQGRRVFANQPIQIKGNFVQRGLVFEWYPAASPLSPAQELEQQRQAVRQLRGATLRGELRLDYQTQFWSTYFLQLWSRAYHDMARRLYRDDPQAALWALDGWFEMTRPRPLDYLNRGLLEADLKKYSQADRDYRAALAADPKFVYAAAALVDLLRAQGRDEEAREWERKVHSMRKAEPEKNNSTPTHSPEASFSPNR